MPLEPIRGNSLSILPPAVAERVAACPVIMQAIENSAPYASPEYNNAEYWKTIGVGFEAAKLRVNDQTLEPHVLDFLARVRDRNKSILDVGCGVGRLTDLVLRQGFENYTGIDINTSNISIAAVRRQGYHFDVADILDYKPWTNFDSAIVSDVLLYMYPPEQIKALMNLQGILNPGAPILVRWARGENIMEPKKAREKPVKGFAFLASEEYIRQVMGISGFSVISIEPVDVPINVGTMDERVQPYHIVHAQK